MRVISLREYVKLLFHKFFKDLVLSNMRALDSLYCAFNACKRIDALMHFAKRPFAEDTAQLILVRDV